MSWTDADEDDFQGPVKIIPMDIVYIGVGFMGRIADAVSETLEDVLHLVGGHINYQRDREDFAERAALEIERITNPLEES